MDIVQICENFSRLSFVDKIKIKQEGEPLPHVTTQFRRSSKGKIILESLIGIICIFKK